MSQTKALLGSNKQKSSPKQNEHIPQANKFPLTKEFFYTMVQLENWLSSSKNYSLQTVDRLIAMYTKCVEYYDSQCDPIKYYFVDKMHSTFTRDETIQILFRKTDLGNSTAIEDLLNKSQIMTEDILQDRKNQRRMVGHKVNMVISLNQETPQNQKLVEGYTHEVQKADTLIRQQLNSQQEQLQQRLEGRRSKSRNHTLGTSVSLVQLDKLYRQELGLVSEREIKTLKIVNKNQLPSIAESRQFSND